MSILIVTFKQHRLLARCLDSLAKATRAHSTETILVVNGVPLQPEHRAAEADGATLLHAPVNLGLPGGLHWARSHSRGRYLAVVQDDVEVDEHWLGALVEILERDSTVGAVGSRILLMDGSPYGDGMIVSRGLLLRDVKDVETCGTGWPVDACYSASCLVRAEAWDSVGGPNPRLFPNQYVDIDLGLRLAEADWSVLVARNSVARHVRNASTTRWQRRYLLQRNREMVIRDHERILEGRPNAFASPDEIAAWLAHLSAVAQRRRVASPPNRTAQPPITLPVLIRNARSDARQVRVGQIAFPVRVGLYHLRSALLKSIRRPHGFP